MCAFAFVPIPKTTQGSDADNLQALFVAAPTESVCLPVGLNPIPLPEEICTILVIGD